uniref:Uncharacterized protein n=1 Tax=Rhizophora mucronata TaxID=61149 RepID=A0A2P2QEG2_RHIMU
MPPISFLFFFCLFFITFFFLLCFAPFCSLFW